MYGHFHSQRIVRISSAAGCIWLQLHRDHLQKSSAMWTVVTLNCHWLCWGEQLDHSQATDTTLSAGSCRQMPEKPINTTYRLSNHTTFQAWKQFQLNDSIWQLSTFYAIIYCKHTVMLLTECQQTDSLYHTSSVNQPVKEKFNMSIQT